MLRVPLSHFVGGPIPQVGPASEHVYVRVGTAIHRWCTECRRLEYASVVGGFSDDAFKYGVENNAIVVNNRAGEVRIGKCTRYGSKRLKTGRVRDVVESEHGLAAVTRHGRLVRWRQDPVQVRPAIRGIEDAETIAAVPGTVERYLVGTPKGLFLVANEKASLFWQHGTAVPRAIFDGTALYVAAGPQIFRLYGGLFPSRVHTREAAKRLEDHERAAAAAVLMAARRAADPGLPTPRLLRGLPRHRAPVLPAMVWRHVLDLAGTLGRPAKAVQASTNTHSLAVPSWV